MSCPLSAGEERVEAKTPAPGRTQIGSVRTQPNLAGSFKEALATRLVLAINLLLAKTFRAGMRITCLARRKPA
jgi:hypothetical protein